MKMSSYSYLLATTYFIASSVNSMYGLPFANEINIIGYSFIGEKIIGWVNNYLYKKMTERNMIRSRELMVFGSNIAVFYLMMGVHHRSSFIANFYESRNRSVSSLNVITFMWKFIANISYYRKLVGITLSSFGLMSFGIIDSLIQRNRDIVINFINQIENSLQNGTTFSIHYYGTEMFLYPPSRRQEITPLSQEELNIISPLRCAGLNNIKKDDEINKEYEKPDNCIICLEKFSEKELHRRLPCLHTFHAGCIDQWLLRSVGECPICKKKVKS